MIALAPQLVPRPYLGAQRQFVITLPASMRPAGWPLRYEFSPCPAERKIFKVRRAIPCSEWAEKHRVVEMSSLPGRWKNEVTPYLAGIMDASWHPGVQTIIVCKTPQVGMSEAINNCIGYAIDRDPAPTLYVYPDESTARHNSTARIQSMIVTSPKLREYTTGVADDMATLEINLQHMAIYMAWASSAAGLANKPIGKLVLDEIDKYPATTSKKEADPISLAEARTTTFSQARKIWKISTPTVETGAIWQALKDEAQVVFHYWVRCPLCGFWQQMEFDRIKFPEGERDPETIESENLAHYECQQCEGHWSDALRNRAVRMGQWRDTKGVELFASLKTRRPRKIGFHVPAWISPFVSLSACAAGFLRGLKDKNKLKNFMNSIKAEPWTDFGEPRDEDRILALRDADGVRPEGTVPSGGIIAGVTAGVDTQDDGFWYEIRAWGYGIDQESWQVRAGFVQSFEALNTVLFEEAITDVDGNAYPVELVVIDSMGHRTSAVWDWARARRGRVFALKGEGRMLKPFDFSKIDYYPTRDGSKKPIPGGLQLLRANVNYYKNSLSTLLEINPTDPGAWHLLATSTQDWARMLVAECLDEQGLWQCPKRKANHGWDCGVYNLVAADVRRIKYRQRPGEQAPAQPKKTQQTNKQAGRNSRW